MRTVPPWVGKNDDSMPPPRVVARIFARCKGCCGNCGRKIMAGERWDKDHILALADGGANVETNFQILCAGCHSNKTRIEARDRAKVRKRLAAAFGIKAPPRRPLVSRGFAPSARRERAGRPSLPPKGIYERPYLTRVGGLDRPMCVDDDE
jgi:hypothetical protein